MNNKKLRQAIKDGDIKQLTEILREDPKGTLRLYGGFTALHVAVKGGNKDVIQAILDAEPKKATTSTALLSPIC